MTIEQLLGLSANEFDKLDDNQLLEYFKEYRNVTRPELAPKPDKVEKKTIGEIGSPTKSYVKNSRYNKVLEEARKIAEQHGLKLGI